ncbi:hypothetical protein [Paenibacillus sp. UNC451MF]|uniref:hypothetical protein n=1 Tax=Paenibacillus sp. UNC451MF TaxID=1449063 RepID=UPI00048D409C|nr:hypothetical protein [Paenibacillus sp. UNC451MF]
MLQKLRAVGTEMKYAIISGLSVFLVLILHLIHWLSAPIMMGAMEMQGHQHDMGGGLTLQTILFTLALLIINGAGMYFAVRQLLLAWKQRKGGLHTYVCCSISLVVLVVGVYSIVF